MSVKRMSVMGVVLLLGVAMAACSARKHAEPMIATAAMEMMEDHGMVDPLAIDFEGTFTRQASRPYRSASHAMGNVYVMPWVNDAGLDAYRALSGPLPMGTVLVKEHFMIMDDVPAESRAAYLVMAKMPAGYDSDHGDWYYAMVDDMAHEVKVQGKVEMCIGCHMQAAGTDYVFGVPDSARVN